MQFLVLSRRRTDQFGDDDFEQLAPSEGAQSRHLYSIGFTRQIWHRGDIPGACQIVEAKDESEVHEKLATLPLAKAGMLDFEIIPLKPYAGFSIP
ncbi:muconolactone Delta-isomerase family protein [Mesorhizobium sp. WSM3224]|uniref:muconolactone Delta-isomerase family protein n=1 Tax=Mesorhizobium sp. WSM3224 TaxID=1040986 RepID=UPI0004150FEB|nr:muconolactone Delta-isomerase family protein [Mesorhizobium sp. WSM3224]